MPLPSAAFFSSLVSGAVDPLAASQLRERRRAAEAALAEQHRYNTMLGEHYNEMGRHNLAGEEHATARLGQEQSQFDLTQDEARRMAAAKLLGEATNNTWTDPGALSQMQARAQLMGMPITPDMEEVTTPAHPDPAHVRPPMPAVPQDHLSVPDEDWSPHAKPSTTWNPPTPDVDEFVEDGTPPSKAILPGFAVQELMGPEMGDSAYMGMIDHLATGEAPMIPESTEMVPTGKYNIGDTGAQVDPEAIKEDAWGPVTASWKAMHEADPSNGEVSEQMLSAALEVAKSHGADPANVKDAQAMLTRLYLGLTNQATSRENAKRMALAQRHASSRSDTGSERQSFKLGQQTFDRAFSKSGGAKGHMDSWEKTNDAIRMLGKPDVNGDYPDVNRTTIAAIIYSLARANDPGARMTDKDISFSTGEQDLYHSSLDQITQWVTNQRPGQVRQLAQHIKTFNAKMSAALIDDAEQLADGARNSFDSEAKRGYEGEVYNAFRALPWHGEVMEKLGVGQGDPKHAPPPMRRSSSSSSKSASVSGKGASMEDLEALMEGKSKSLPVKKAPVKKKGG